MSKRISLLAFSLVATLNASMATSQNYLTNSEFDNDASGWIAATWDGSMGSPSPGSATMSRSSPGSYFIQQCVNVPVGSYDVIVRFFIDSGSPTTNAVLIPYDQPCGGNGNNLSGSNITSEQTTPVGNDWIEHRLVSQPPAPPTMKSILVMASSGGINYTVHVDHILLVPTGTPVQLQSFNVD